MGEKLNSTIVKQRWYDPDDMFSSRNYLFNGEFMDYLNQKDGFHNG